MRLKPSKCRSFSLNGGKPTSVHYKIGEDVVPTIAEEEQKFLGRLLFFSGKSSETFNHIKETLLSKLKNIDSCAVRSEYKLKIYHKYLLPSIRFLLTIHDITATDLKKLDTLNDKFIKKWAGLPPCATNAFIHMNNTMNIKSITALYQETHCVTHTATRLKGDSAVNHVLDCRVTRESEWTRKKSITVRAQKEFEKAENLNTVFGAQPVFEDIPATVSKFHNTMKEAVKERVVWENDKQWHEHVKTLLKQGNFIDLLKTSKTDATWQSFIYDLPKGTMKFLLNSCLDTLPTLVNLHQWGKSSSNLCPHCCNRHTTNHILNCCDTFLNQGRYTWRHDNILHYIIKLLNRTSYTVYSDIPGFSTSSNGTIPPNLCVTTEKPDIVIIDEAKKTVDIFELTVPFDTRIDKAHKLKMNKYSHFTTDINRNYSMTITAFEVSSRGQITRDNKQRLKRFFKFTDNSTKFKTFINNVSSLAIASSYYIFVSRKEPSWSTDTASLSPIFK